ncbi:Peptidyl-prolyl cis-trans isomerase FKBP19, chloroplastic, partial [Ananas comosus]
FYRLLREPSFVPDLRFFSESDNGVVFASRVSSEPFHGESLFELLLFKGEIFERRKLLLLSTFGFALGAFQHTLDKEVAVASEFADMPALRGKDFGKTKMRYPDYTETNSGLQYKDLRVGNGPFPKIGETVVVDWDGYTIGYYGRIFEARNKTKGGSFEGGDKDFFKFKLGSGQVIPAFEEAIAGMAPGGIRR